MPPGGRRPGSGRPKGARNKKTVVLLEKTAEYGVTPLDVMLITMRDAWQAAQDEAVDADIRAQARALAMAAAKDAAPYLHPKLSNVESRNENRNENRTVSPDPPSEDEWERQYGSLAPPAGATEGPH